MVFLALYQGKCENNLPKNALGTSLHPPAAARGSVYSIIRDRGSIYIIYKRIY